MKKAYRAIFYALTVLLFVAIDLHAQSETPGGESLPLKVILDTDPGYDPDDMGCMAMLHTMSTLGECEILAIMNSTEHRESPLTISAVNYFYGREAIPIGDYKAYEQKLHVSEDFYSGYIARAYPRDMVDYTEAIDGVELYRQILASADAQSITIVIIGTMHNFSALLQSGPCAYSELDGIGLVREKVKQVVTMGGNFIDGSGLDRTNWGGSDELCAYTSWSCLNVERNRMCRYVVDHCPAPFVASGWEVGCGDYHDAAYGNVMTGQGLKELAKDHIIRRAYEYHFRHREGSDQISRHSNDQCALHFAIRGEGENYALTGGGNIHLSEQGVCTWSPEAGMKQGYIQKKRDKDEIAAEIEALMMAPAQEPDRTGPAVPGNVHRKKVKGGSYMEWDASTDPDPASWVVAYRVYRDEMLQETVFGCRYIIPGKFDKKTRYEVRAINASGAESPGGLMD